MFVYSQNISLEENKQGQGICWGVDTRDGLGQFFLLPSLGLGFGFFDFAWVGLWVSWFSLGQLSSSLVHVQICFDKSYQFELNKGEY